MSAVDLVKSAIGTRQVSALGYTNPFGAQCVSLDAWYLEQLGYKTPIMPGYNAIDVYNKNPLGLQKIAPKDLQPGDLFFKDYVGGDGVNYGHTGIVISNNSASIQSVDQNWFHSSLTNGSPAAQVTHPINTLVGGLRPLKEDIMPEDKVYTELNKRDKRMDDIEKKLNDLYNIVNTMSKNLDTLIKAGGKLDVAYSDINQANIRIDKLEKKG